MNDSVPEGVGKIGPTGVIAPLLTPFDKRDQLDRSGLESEIHFLLGEGVLGLSPGGSTGEGAALDDDEVSAIVRTCKEIAPKGTPIVAGVIRSSTRAAVHTAKVAEDAGADYLMITPTFYNILVPDEHGNQRFYEGISSQIRLPIIIYNVVPQNEITPALFASLIKTSKVIGIKQSLGSVDALYSMVLSSQERGRVYAATDGMLATCFGLGASGAISAILTLFPRATRAMWDLVQAGNLAAALDIQKILFPVWERIQGKSFPARLKCAVRAQGRDCGQPRSPLHELEQTETKEITGAVREADEALRELLG